MPQFRLLAGVPQYLRPEVPLSALPRGKEDGGLCFILMIRACVCNFHCSPLLPAQHSSLDDFSAVGLNCLGVSSFCRHLHTESIFYPHPSSNHLPTCSATLTSGLWLEGKAEQYLSGPTAPLPLIHHMLCQLWEWVSPLVA